MEDKNLMSPTWKKHLEDLGWIVTMVKDNKADIVCWRPVWIPYLSKTVPTLPLKWFEDNWVLYNWVWPQAEQTEEKWDIARPHTEQDEIEEQDDNEDDVDWV